MGYEDEGRARARHAIANFLLYSADAISLVQLTQDGTRALVRIRDQLDSLNVPPVSDSGVRARGSIKERAAVAQKEIGRDFPLLNSHTIIGLWGALEACIDDIAEGWIASDRASAARQSIAGLRVQLGDILYLDASERWRWIVEQLKRHQGSALKTGVGQFESLLTAIGLGGEVDEDIRKTLFLVKAVRNLLAHRAGRVDEKFIASFPDADLQVGQQLYVNTTQVFAAIFAMIYYVNSLAERKALTVTDAGWPEWLPSPRQVLVDFESILSTSRSKTPKDL